MRIAARAAVVLSVLATAACVASTPADSSSGAAPAASAQPSANALEPFGSPGSGACAPAAPTIFENAICVCDDLAQAGAFTTHAAANGAASVGVDGRTAAGTGSSVEGSFIAYGGLDVGGVLEVRGDLSVGGPFEFAGALTVDGTLRLGQPSTVLVPLHVAHTGAYAAPSAPPCDCGASSVLPITQKVAAAATQNDNAAHGLSPDGASLLGVGSLTLTTGNYYFHDVTRIGVGSVTIQGAVSLAFDGAAFTIGAGQISLAPGASLDLYVAGELVNAGAIELGDPAHPEALRIFVGGAGATISSAGPQLWSGLVYAPGADVRLAGVTEIHGAIFAKSLTWAGVLDVTYAGGALSAPASCSNPPPPPSAK